MNMSVWNASMTCFIRENAKKNHIEKIKNQISGSENFDFTDVIYEDNAGYTKIQTIGIALKDSKGNVKIGGTHIILTSYYGLDYAWCEVIDAEPYAYTTEITENYIALIKQEINAGNIVRKTSRDISSIYDFERVLYVYDKLGNLKMTVETNGLYADEVGYYPFEDFNAFRV